MAELDVRARQRVEANRLIDYHSPISERLTNERTSLESRLIPVTGYILVACGEAYFRYPDLMRRIDAALPAERIGALGRRPGLQVNTVSLWSIANFWLVGRKMAQQIDPSHDDPADGIAVLDFWERAAMAFRGDGHRQAIDAGGVVRPYDHEVIATLTGSVVPVDEATRSVIKRFSATLTSYLFLLYFDTRVGTGNTGPWPLPDGRVLVVRDFYRLGPSDFWWSDVAADVPYRNLTAALVLDDVDVAISEFGTCRTDPEDYLDRLVGFSLFTTDGPDGGAGPLRPVPLDELDGIVAEVRRAQAAHYRRIAAMTRDDKVRCGAYVYFSFLKPFADLAGLTDLDWSLPRALPEGWYEFLSATEGTNTGVAEDGPYYAPYPPQEAP